MHDFKNLTFTSFPTTFDPLDLMISVLLFLLDRVNAEVFPSFSKNLIWIFINNDKKYHVTNKYYLSFQLNGIYCIFIKSQFRKLILIISFCKFIITFVYKFINTSIYTVIKLSYIPIHEFVLFILRVLI